MKRLHLICNAHLDPYWMWEWEEGAAEAISTFRTAADFCEDHDGFVFNHNEVILYKWVAEYEPALFERIQRLVREKKWHIMGGWYLQPDCNMPSGESFIRQILLGKRYFKKHFDVEPTTAINFDPFGHSRGLVQIMAKSGYNAYIHSRPDNVDCPLPDTDYTWVGFDGSEVAGHRTLVWYGTPARGMTGPALEKYLEMHSDRELGLFTWGIGNHGGGPSLEDLRDIKAIAKKHTDFPIVHSTPEAYFAERRERNMAAPRVERDLNPWGIGCYTSQVRLKQKHRLLENELYAVEKMCSNGALSRLLDYPAASLQEALEDLLVAEFHDILPGSSIQAVEDAGLRLLDHGLEILSRLKARAFFAFATGQPKAEDGVIPVFVYNPHPYPVAATVVCEFNLPDRHEGGVFFDFDAVMNGNAIPCQAEKEVSNIPLEWRKRCVFQATLAPSQLNRVDCTPRALPGKPKPQPAMEGNALHFDNGCLDLLINCETGLVDRFRVDGKEILRPGAFSPIVIQDDEDPWGMCAKTYRNEAGRFTLMSAEAGTRFSGLNLAEPLPSVRVVEDGPVRAVVECLMAFNHSFLVLTYKIPKRGSELEVHVRVHWNEKDRMLKLAMPTCFSDAVYWGQVACGRDQLPGHEREVVAQKWTAALSPSQQLAFTCINEGTYGSDFPDGEVRMTLLRSPAYSAHPVEDRTVLPQDRYTPRCDQGERQFRFWFNAGAAKERLEKVDREALAHNEEPMALSFYPAGTGVKPPAGVLLSDPVILLMAFKKAEDGDGYLIRLFEPTGTARSTTLSIPALDLEETIALKAFEIKTLHFSADTKSVEERDLLERPLA
ncbi:MAG: glycoside hydrolase family 38 C-terminal domain-containing protein [Candidatus Hydrogenedentales bacterium]|jgi:alpha-mannosidase